MTRKTVLIIFSLVSTALLLGACQAANLISNDYSEYTFETYAEAEKSGEIERGWIPEFVPETAKDIHLGYDIDTNDILLTFTVDNQNFVDSSGCLPTDTKASHALEAKWWSDTIYDDPAVRFYQ